MLSMDDLWKADLLIVAVYGFYVILVLLLSYSLYKAIGIFRGKISWGKARIMGVPSSIFIWIQAVFYLVLFDATYGLVGLILWTPLWLDLLISLLVIALVWWIFWRLSKRSTFKRHLFIPLVMVPLGLPGAHVVGQLAQTGVIEVSQKVGVGILKYGHSLDGLAIKNVDTLVEAVPVIRHFPRTMKTVAGEVTFRHSLEKGILGDALTARRFTALGYSKLPSKYNMVNGIDGIFVKRNGAGEIVELVIVETKVDTGRLALKQMTDEWITTAVTKMRRAADAEVIKTGDLVHTVLQDRPEIVRKELWQHHLSDGSTVVRSVDPTGRPAAVLREWSDNFIKNQLLIRCRQGVFQCQLQ